jgi:integrase
MRQVRLGRWPAVSYPDALTRWNAARELRAGGLDPRVHERERRASRLAAAREAAAARRLEAVTVAVLVERYERDVVPKIGTAKSQATMRSALKHARTQLGPRVASTVNRIDADNCLQAVKSTAPTVAGQLRGLLRRVWNHGVVKGLLAADLLNPWADKPLTFEAVKSGRDRALNDAEIATFLERLPTAGFAQNIADALALTLLTGARSGEVIGMTGRSVDAKRGTWHLCKTKTGAKRTIALPRQALPMALRYIAGEPVRDQSDLSDAVRAAQAHFGLSEWKPHDLRHSARTGWARLRFPEVVCEAGLGHSKRGVAGTYDQHSYAHEVGEMLQSWADHLEALQAPQVSPLKLKRRA